MPALDSSRQILRDLVQHLQDDRMPRSDEPGYTPLIHVIGDVGRAVGEPQFDLEDLLRTLPAIAALREAFETDNDAESIPTTPWAALQSNKSVPYAAGALWACSAIIERALERRRLQARRETEKVGRAELRTYWMQLMQEAGQVRLSDVKESLAASGLEADDSQISKAVGDLMADGLVRPAENPPEGDRRARYYELTRGGVPGSVRRALWKAARHARAHVPADQARRLFDEALGTDLSTAGA